MVRTRRSDAGRSNAGAPGGSARQRRRGWRTWSWRAGRRPAGGGRGAESAGVAGLSRQFRFAELVNAQGGLTPLLFASRQGFGEAAQVLLDAGAGVNQISGADKTSPLLMAVINGHFDLAKKLLERARIRTLASDNGVTPLYAVLNVQWAPRALYPQPRAYLQQKTDVSRSDEAAARQGRGRQRPAERRRSGTLATTSICRASTRSARRRSGAPRTPATSTR